MFEQETEYDEDVAKLKEKRAEINTEIINRLETKVEVLGSEMVGVRRELKDHQGVNPNKIEGQDWLVCPKCGSDDVDYRAEIDLHDGIEVWCESCNLHDDIL